MQKLKGQGGDGEEERDVVYLIKRDWYWNQKFTKGILWFLSDNADSTALKNLSQVST